MMDRIAAVSIDCALHIAIRIRGMTGTTKRTDFGSGIYGGSDEDDIASLQRSGRLARGFRGGFGE